jgi:diguanylate cyclase (GGDEF)-like protein
MKKYSKMSFVPKNPWNLIWLALVSAVALTALANFVQSLIWYGYVSNELLIIGTIDAMIVSILIAPVVIKLVLGEQQRVKDELRALAITDDLTGLNNRRGFYLLAEQLLKIAQRTKTGLYLMYTDLDDFKNINDEHGHAEGDVALQTYARLLKENYRESDIIARIGGDEFVLLPVGTTKDGIEVIRNRFYTVLSSFNDIHDYPWTLSATIGIAYFDPESPCSLEELLVRADQSLYEQKRQEKND